MKLLASIITTIFLASGSAYAAEGFLGFWASGENEVLEISRDGADLQAEFIRKNVKNEFQKIRFPVKINDGVLYISGEQGDVSAMYDTDRERLVLGGFKDFVRISSGQARVLVETLEKQR